MPTLFRQAVQAYLPQQFPFEGNRLVCDRLCRQVSKSFRLSGQGGENIAGRHVQNQRPTIEEHRRIKILNWLPLPIPAARLWLSLLRCGSNRTEGFNQKIESIQCTAKWPAGMITWANRKKFLRNPFTKANLWLFFSKNLVAVRQTQNIHQII